MPKIKNCLIARSEITELKKLSNNSIVFSTKLHGIRIINPEDCQVTFNFAYESLNSKTNVLAFSPDEELLAFANDTVISVVHMPSRKVINTIHTHNEKAELLSFDQSSTYLLVGTSNGRVLQYRFNNSSLLSRLCSSSLFNEKKNPISCFALHNNTIAYSAYGGSISIVHLYSQSNKTVLQNLKASICALCFSDAHTLISGNSDGIVEIRSLLDKNIYVKINTPFTKVTQILLMPNPHYIMVCGGTNTLAIIDIQKSKILHSKYLEFEDKVQKFELIGDDILIVVLHNSKILSVELPSLAKLKSLLLHNSLDKAFHLITKEPMLENSAEHNELLQRYEKIYLEAIKALINQNKELAILLTSMFKNVNSKKEEIRSLFLAFENYSRFKTYYLEKKYTIAYIMASKYPALQHTVQYKKMEEIWRETFSNAQRHIILGKIDNARALLNEYITLNAKRPIIQLILNQNSLFLEFLKAIDEKNFKKVNALVLKNELFSQMPSFIKLEKEMRNSIQIIQDGIQTGNLNLAKEYFLKLKDTPYMSQKLAQLNLEYNSALKLQKAYNENNFKSCYEILDLHPSLGSTNLGILLEKHWMKLMDKCELYALKANIADIKKTLGELIDLSTRRDKIGALLRVSFHTKIKILMAKKSFKNAENIIYSYIDIFGLDNDITVIMQKFEAYSSFKLALTQDQR
ncbi:WD40 repeat domain-containing protein, partial [bacterium]|nr:WD40 repeat domain-containing protein [bacterium]MBU1995243.1 WD40 repeat domain-containing protein [bacterium]